MGSFDPSVGLVFRSKDPVVVDFQATRCSLAVKQLQSGLSDMAQTLASIVGCEVHSKRELESEDPDVLSKTAYLVLDYMDFEIQSAKDKPIRCTWAPIMIFICGTQISSLRAAYDKKGAHISGTTTLQDGEITSNRCRTVNSATRLLVSHLSTMVLKK